MYLKYLQDTFPYLNITDSTANYNNIVSIYVSAEKNNSWVEISIIYQDENSNPYIAISSLSDGNKSLVLAREFEAIDYYDQKGLPEEIEEVLYSIPFVKKYKRDYIIKELK